MDMVERVRFFCAMQFAQCDCAHCVFIALRLKADCRKFATMFHTVANDIHAEGETHTEDKGGERKNIE